MDFSKETSNSSFGPAILINDIENIDGDRGQPRDDDRGSFIDQNDLSRMSDSLVSNGPKYIYKKEEKEQTVIDCKTDITYH